MKQCNNCRYLGEPILGFLDEEYEEYGETGFYVCDFVKHMNSTSSESPNDAIVGVEDGSGYFARLVVKGEFGCIKWEESEQESES